MTVYTYNDPHFDNYKEILQVLHLIVSEFESDPSSVACFDLRTVQRAKDAITERKRLERSGGEPPLLTGGVEHAVKSR